MARFANYVKSSGLTEFRGLKIEPLIDTDVARRVLESKSLGYVDLQMYPAQLPLIQPESGKVKDALEYQLEVWSEQKQLRFYVEPTGDSSVRAMDEFRGPFSSLISTWARWAGRGNTFKVKCSHLVDGALRDVVVDVLSGKLTTEKSVDYKGIRTSALDEQSAFDAINEAHIDLQADIQRSVLSMRGL